VRLKFSFATIFLSAAVLCIAAPSSSGQSAKDSAGQSATDVEKLSARPKLSDPRPGEVPFQCGTSAGQTLANFLANLTPSSPHTIRVSGTCHENITITGFNRLTLLAAPGASINDASGGVNSVVTVLGASTFDVEGFTVNGGGPQGALICAEYSTCTFAGNVFQGSSGDGVDIIRSNAIFVGDVIQNNGFRGLAVVNSASALLQGMTLQGNSAAGAAVISGSNLTAVNTTVQNNGLQGLFISAHATLRLFDCLITGNGHAGVRAEAASEVSLAPASTTGTIITNNGVFGVNLLDLSFGGFGPGNNVTGNLAGIDVQCVPQFSATRGALTNINGGITNCVEP
jgi:parallel beta helix pectate lyase-like protein